LLIKRGGVKMHAYDRFLPEWFNRIRSRQITLPRFQRFEAWGHGEISDLLTTVLRELPAGATLILQVGDYEKFKSRTMIDAPTEGDRVTEQLLDGQQRLTALWRALNDKFPYRTYLIGFDQSPEDPPLELPYVYGQARWYKNENRYPRWVDDPSDCLSHGYIPIRLLRPEDILPEIREWVAAAVNGDRDKKDVLFDRIISLRDKVKAFNLPYLALPPATPKEVAIDVFIKMNTSSVRLSTYDFVVALVEEETGKSLHEHVEVLAEAVPRAADYADLPGLVLDVVALRQDHVPSQAGYKAIDYNLMLNEWKTIVAGIKEMVCFLEEERVFDAQRLPNYAPLPVLAALWEYLPTQPDLLGNARLLLRKYTWRSFLTSRYEKSTATSALQDYRALRQVLLGKSSERSVPVFEENDYPIPDKDMLLPANWPKRKTTLGRGILGLQLKCGAVDFADGKEATAASITSKEHPREYHHLFPESTLEDAAIGNDDIYRALNCALITWRTNRTISNKDPIGYLKERADVCALGEEELGRRLNTHLIPYHELAVGYGGLLDDERRSRAKEDYYKFLNARAGLLAKAARRVCDGKTLEVSELFNGVE
jgi:hypothetical protein